MKILLVIDLPGVTSRDDAKAFAAQFADTLANSTANEDAIIHTITSFIPKEKTS